MSTKHTLDELNKLSREELVTIILTMQGQREIDLKDFSEEIIPPHTVPEEKLNAFYGKATGSACRMKRISVCAMNRSPEQEICKCCSSLPDRAGFHA